MDVWIIYLIIGTSIGFLAVSYKAEKPVLGMFAGILLFLTGLSLFSTGIQMPNGQIIASNQTSVNDTFYNITTSYTNIDTNTGIAIEYWSLAFIIFGFYLFAEGIYRVTKTRKSEPVTEED